jgi:hypothetical protein
MSVVCKRNMVSDYNFANQTLANFLSDAAIKYTVRQQH